MRKKSLVSFLFFAWTISCFAQWGAEEMVEKPSFKDRIFTGGGLGLGFSSYSDYVSISPLIGYRLKPKLAAGVGLQYQYTNYKNVTPSFSTNNYGTTLFTRYNFYQQFFLHLEYEYLSYEYLGVNGEHVRKGYNSVLGGGGFYQPIGRHAAFFLTALYNFSYQSPSNQYTILPYNSPWVLRAGITAGF